MTVSFQSVHCVSCLSLDNKILWLKQFGWFFSYSYLKVAKCLQTNSSSVNAFYVNAEGFFVKQEQEHADWVIIVAY